MKLANKVAIITGGSRGIGRGVAVAFAHEGAAVAIVGRNKQDCDATAAFISGSGGTAISIPAMYRKRKMRPVLRNKPLQSCTASIYW